jgi:putative hydrolase of the HAD superfamily
VSTERLSAVLFDLDDTLYEYAPCNRAGLGAAHSVLDAYSALDAGRFEALHDEVRTSLAQRLAGQAASHNRAIFFKLVAARHLGREQPSVAVEMYASYWDAFLGAMSLAPGAGEVLSALGREHALALVTNHTTEIQLRKVARLGIEDLFSVIVTSEEAGVEKPHARIYESALSALSIEPSRAVMVGDNPEVDLRGARTAGLGTVLSTEFRPSASPDPWAQEVVDRISDVPAALARLDARDR